MKPLEVARWEVIGNARDRRTLLSALILGPLLGPMLFAGLMTWIVERGAVQRESVLRVPVVGGERAPNLIRHLAQAGIEPAEDGPATFDALQHGVRSGRYRVGVHVPEDAPDALRSGRPMRIQVVQDSSESSDSGVVRRVQSGVRSFGRLVVQQRLALRGVSALSVQGVVIDDVDVSTPTGRAVVILGSITFFLLFATLAGGLYLATDATAGERERGSLEPLLALPVSRTSLVLGKILATTLYMLLSLAITLAGFGWVLPRLPLSQLGMSVNFGVGVIAGAFAVMIPFAVMGAGLLTFVAAFTRSYREAQSYLGFVILLPTLPVMAASVAGVRPTPWLHAVPALGQHLIVTSLIKAEPVSWLAALLSVAGTSALATLLIGATVWFFQRERILG